MVKQPLTKQVIEQQKSMRCKCVHNRKHLAEMPAEFLLFQDPNSTAKFIGSCSAHPQSHLISSLD